MSVADADNAEKVRAVIAITLVGVLIALQFWPSANKTLTASAETLAIAVVAFYFGLHSGTSPRLHPAQHEQSAGPNSEPAPSLATEGRVAIDSPADEGESP